MFDLLLKFQLERMWEDEGYNALRIPINLISMCGILIMEESYWPFKEGTEITRAAFITHKYLEFCKLLKTYVPLGFSLEGDEQSKVKSYVNILNVRTGLSRLMWNSS